MDEHLLSEIITTRGIIGRIFYEIEKAGISYSEGDIELEIKENDVCWNICLHLYKGLDRTKTYHIEKNQVYFDGEKQFESIIAKILVEIKQKLKDFKFQNEQNRKS